MLIKSIKLENFRQFRNESIDFAFGDNGQNVTIIIGENGTGKTTFAQAFFWCLFGATSFSDKVILNKIEASELTPSETKDVKVSLSLRHGDVDYTLTRKQTYHKDYSNNIKADNTIFEIKVTGTDGISRYIPKSQCELEVKKLLPKELSRYFFFDGERIEKMSKDISQGNKATDFADAVKGLLGLNAMLKAIEHFNPRSKTSVIGSYENSFNGASNKKIELYSEQINKCKNKQEEIDKRLEEIVSQIKMAQRIESDKISEIKQYSDGEKLQNQKEKLNGAIEFYNQNLSHLYQEICKNFNHSMSSFISLSLIKRTLEFLSTQSIDGKDIPYMHQKTIEYLLKRKSCICGTHLDEGSVPYNKVKELIEYLPPKSISTTVSTFKDEARSRIDKLIDLLQETESNLELISQFNENIENSSDELHKIDSQLSGENVRDKVRSLNREINECREIIDKNSKERDSLNKKLGCLESEIAQADKSRQELTLLDNKNKKNQQYLSYARRVYSELEEDYNSSEKKIREKLQYTINELFKQIYDGDLFLTIDEKYHITVEVKDFSGEVENSTAQSISVIFAFITAIIKIARDNRNAVDENSKLLSSEPYPLVMDAPLSSFDKRRIKTVCESLPKVAEQVIIFIKDTDGDLAEEYMGNKIGSRHRFEKKNEFETVLN